MTTAAPEQPAHNQGILERIKEFPPIATIIGLWAATVIIISGVREE